MRKNIPKTLLRTRYRRELWRNARRIVRQLERVLPIRAAYLLGSFTTRKTRPADVDFIILLQIDEQNPRTRWSVDLVIAPDNTYGATVLKDADAWVRKKYGRKHSATIRLK